MSNLYRTTKNLGDVLNEALPHRSYHFASEGKQLNSSNALTIVWGETNYEHEEAAEGSDHKDAVPHSYTTTTPITINLIGGEVEDIEADKETLLDTLRIYKIDNTTHVRVQAVGSPLRGVDTTKPRRLVIELDLISQLRT